MYLTEWREFPLAPCLAEKKWLQLVSRCCWNGAGPWHASEIVSFLTGLRTYQHPIRVLHTTYVMTILFILTTSIASIIFFATAQQPPVVQGLLIVEDSRSNSDTPHSVGLLWTSDQSDTQTSTWQHTTLTTDKHPYPGGIRTRNPNKLAAADPRLWPLGHWVRSSSILVTNDGIQN